MIVRKLTMEHKATSMSLRFFAMSEESHVLRNRRKKKENPKDFVCKDSRSIMSKEEENTPV